MDTNTAPVARADSNTAKEAGGIANGSLGHGATGNVLLNDTDADAGAALHVSAIRANNGNVGVVGQRLTGSSGYLTLHADGSYSYEVREGQRDALDTGDVATDRFTYTVMDQFGATSTAVLTISVQGTNDAAVAANISATIGKQGATYTGQATATDVDDSVHSFRLVGNAPEGVVFNTNGSFTVAPLASDQSLGVGATRIVSFQYVANDGEIDSAPATVSITITGSNAPPVSQNDSNTAREAGGIANGSLGYSATGNVLTNDSDADRDSLTVSGIRSNGGTVGAVGVRLTGSHGYLTLNADGSYLYQIREAHRDALDTGDVGTDRFVYTISDGQGGSSQATLTFTVLGSNDAAVAANISATIGEDSSGYIGQATAADVDDSVHSFRLVETAQDGVVFNSDGSFTVIPTAADQGMVAGESRIVSFQYVANDGEIDSAPATITITIKGADDTATLSGDSTGRVIEAGVDYDDQPIAGTSSVSGSLTVVDPDSGQAGTQAQSEVAGQYGQFSIDGSGNWTYTLASGEAAVEALGEDQERVETFVVYSIDGSASQAVTITVQGSNDDPYLVAAVAGADVTEDSGASLTSSGSFTFDDPEATNIHGIIGIAGASANTLGGELTATLAASASGSGVGRVEWTYHLANSAAQGLGAGDSVVESFTVSVSDGLGGQLDQVIDVVVHGVNDTASLSGDFSGNAGENGPDASGSVVASDADDGESGIRAQDGASGQYGSFSIGSDGQWSYSADNGNSLVNSLTTGDSVIDSFTVYSTDGSASQTVSITIKGQNDAPVAQDDSASATEGGASISGSVATNDSDAEGSSLSYSLDGCEAPAGLTLNADGSYLFDPTVSAYDHLAAGASEQVSVQILVSDGHSTTSSSLTITVTGTNDGPVAVDDSACATEGGASVTGSVATNDSDADDAASLSYSLVSPVTGLTLNADGSYSFDPTGTAYDHIAADSSATVSASYIVVDEHGSSDVGVLTITVNGSNDAASISGNASGSVTEAGGVDNGTAGVSSVSGSLSVSDIDDGESVFQASCGSAGSDGGYGSYSIDAAGQWTYTLDNGNATVQGLRHNQTLQDSFTVYSHDGSASQAVSITITGRNDAPYIVTADSGASLTEDSGVSSGKLSASGNISFDDHETLNFHAVSVTAASGNSYSGVLSAVLGTPAQGSGVGQIGWTYSLDNSSVQGLGDGQSVVEHYSVVIADSAGASRVQDIAITVTGANDGIVLGGGSLSGSLKEDDSASIGGSIAFTDADLTDTHEASVSGGSYGTGAAIIGIDSTGGASGSVSWTYTVDNEDGRVQALAVGESLADSFTVSLDDGHGGSVSQVIQVVIDGINDAPDLASQSQAEKLGDIAGSQSFSLDFSDADLSDTHTVTAGSAGQGSVSVSIGDAATGTGNGAVRIDYTVSASLAGTLSVGESLADSFTVTLSDSQGATSSQTVQVLIEGINDAPTVVSYTGDDNNIVTEDQGVVSGLLRDSGVIGFDDADKLDTHSISVVASQGNSLGGSLTTSLVNSAVGASVGQLSYQYNVSNAAVQHLAADEVATEVFSIVIADAHGGSVVQSVVMSVQGRNDAPVGVNDSVGLGEDGASLVIGASVGVLANDTDVDNGHVLSVTGVRTGAIEGQGIAGQVNVALAGQYGSLTLHADGSYEYVLNNNASIQALGAGESLVDSFNYRVSDGTAADSAVLNITINGSNDLPVISNFVNSASISEDTGLVGPEAAFTVSDIDSPASLVGLTLSTPRYGTAIHSASLQGENSLSGRWFYAVDGQNATVNGLAAGESLADSFVVSYSDGEGGSASQVVTITVNGVNDAPVASNAVGSGQSIGEDSTATLSGSFQVSDVERQTLQAQAANGSYGTATATLVNGQVSWSYDLDEVNATVQALNAGQSMADSFTVTVSDTQGGSVVQTVNVVINGDDDGPFQVFKLGADLQSVEIRWPTQTTLYSMSGSSGQIMLGSIGPQQEYLANIGTLPSSTNHSYAVLNPNNQIEYIANVSITHIGSPLAVPNITNLLAGGTATASLNGAGLDDFLFRGGVTQPITFTGGGGNDTYINFGGNGIIGTGIFAVDTGHDTIHGLKGTLTVRAGASATAYVYQNIDLTDAVDLTNNGSAELIVMGNHSLSLVNAKGSSGWTLGVADSVTSGVSLTGSNLADTITGGAGSDFLHGQGGADLIVASAGSDTYSLGSDLAVDTVRYDADYELETTALRDTILNFTSGTDKIDLAGLLDTLDAGVYRPLVGLDASSGSGTIVSVSLGSGNFVDLAFVSGASLVGSDLIVGDHMIVSMES